MRRPDLTQDELDRIAELRERGRSEEAIARTVGCSKGSVSWALLKLGVDIHADRPLPPVPDTPVTMVRRGHVIRRFTKAEDARLLALEQTGIKTWAIAQAMGRRNNSIIGRMRTLARRQARQEAQAGQ
jgi:hypothetical protein